MPHTAADRHSLDQLVTGRQGSIARLEQAREFSALQGAGRSARCEIASDEHSQQWQHAFAQPGIDSGLLAACVGNATQPFQNLQARLNIDRFMRHDSGRQAIAAQFVQQAKHGVESAGEISESGEEPGKQGLGTGQRNRWRFAKLTSQRIDTPAQAQYRKHDILSFGVAFAPHFFTTKSSLSELRKQA